MRSAPHWLVKFALATWPHEFRSEYETQIAADAEDTDWQGWRGLLALCANVAWSGVMLRLETLWRNLSFANRILVKAPVFTIVVVATLAVGVGVNVALFSILDTALIKPLPYPASGRLVFVGVDVPKYWGLSYPEARDVAARTRTLFDLSLSISDEATLNGAGKPLRLTGRMISGPYFDALRAHPKLGRVLEPADAGKAVTVISEATWHKYFAANPSAIGRAVLLEGRAFTIVGVMPAGLYDPRTSGLVTSDYWVPLDPAGLLAKYRGDYSFTGIARVRDSVSLEAAAADTKRVFDGLAAQYPLNHKNIYNAASRTLVSMQASIASRIAPLVLLLYAAVTLVLLIACTNVANMQLMRAVVRNREFVVRGALGAPARAIAAQMLCEAALLAAAGGALGVGFAALILRIAATTIGRVISQWHTSALDARALFYALAISIAVTLVVGLLPAIKQRKNLADDLKAAWRADHSKSGKSLQSTLVSVEVALAIAVTIAAGLIARSFVQLSSVDVGFRAQNAFALTVPDLPPARYPTPESRLRFVRRLANSLKHLPGVRETAIAEDVPFQDTDMSTFTLPNRPSVHNLVKSFGVSREFFATLGVPLLRGRTFSENDRSGSSPVAIVNAAFARKYFGGLDVTQKQLRLDRSIPVDASPPVRTIVGIVGDVRETLSSEPSPTIYVPIAQLPSPNSIVIRTAGRDAALANEASRKTQQLDPMLPDPQLVSLPSLIADDANSARLALILFCVLGSIALLLAALGIYGVSSYSVMKRVQDFGIRMAVGAHQTQIIRLVVVAALQSSLVGIVFGVMLSALTATFTSTLLFGVSPYDMRTFAAAILLALICTLLSSIVPALRASRLDPCAALRYE